MSAELDVLREQYKAWVAKWKAGGKPTRSYVAPCCHGVIETPVPPSGESWDSLTTCPHCGTLHFKIVTAVNVRAHLVSPATRMDPLHGKPFSRSPVKGCPQPEDDA